MSEVIREVGFVVVADGRELSSRNKLYQTEEEAEKVAMKDIANDSLGGGASLVIRAVRFTTKEAKACGNVV